MTTIKNLYTAIIWLLSIAILLLIWNGIVQSCDSKSSKNKSETELKYPLIVIGTDSVNCTYRDGTKYIRYILTIRDAEKYTYIGECDDYNELNSEEIFVKTIYKNYKKGDTIK